MKCPRCGVEIALDPHNLSVYYSPFPSEDGKLLVVDLSCWSCAWYETYFATDMLEADEEND